MGNTNEQAEKQYYIIPKNEIDNIRFQLGCRDEKETLSAINQMIQDHSNLIKTKQYQDNFINQQQTQYKNLSQELEQHQTVNRELESFQKQAVIRIAALEENVKSERENYQRLELQLKSHQKQLKEELKAKQILEREIANLNVELTNFRVTRSLQNTGKVVNGETQTIVLNCSKHFTIINDRTFECLCACPELPDHFIHFITNAIFEVLLSQMTVDNLTENSWNRFLSYADNDQLKQAMNPGKRLFTAVVKQIIELFETSQRAVFPKINLVWLKENESLDERFELKEVISIHDDHVQSGFERIIPVLPALLVGESSVVDRKGMAIKVKYI